MKPSGEAPTILLLADQRNINASTVTMKTMIVYMVVSFLVYTT